MPPTREAEKAIRFPSGDHAGEKSGATSRVNRELTFRFISMIQIPSSRRDPAPEIRVVATRAPSGDSARTLYEKAPSSPTAPIGLPSRSNHESLDSGLAARPERNASTLSPETLKPAASRYVPIWLAT